MKDKFYLCIDLKSFFASVECVERGLDPMVTNLVVADPSRSEKTICLAITPAMKALGIKNRCRVYEIPKGVEYIMAPPRMRKYIEYSAKVYSCYLKFVAKEDIHVYSIDEVFIDATPYLKLYKMTAKELAVTIINDVIETTGITATCGIGTNMYLAKIALDITAKKVPDHIGYLDEEQFKKTLWEHKPITDFWGIGKGTAARLERLGIYNMGQIAACDEKKLYKMFGIDAEIMIDHSKGLEPVTMADVKAYRSTTHSIDRSQVLMRNYSADETRIIVQEMVELMCLELVDENLATRGIVLYLGRSDIPGRPTDKGSMPLGRYTSSMKDIMPISEQLFDKIAHREGLYRKVSISFIDIKPDDIEQLDLFTDPITREKEKNMQKAIISIKKKFGKNAMFKGMDLQDAATTIERNAQIGGHKSGDDKY